MNVNITTTLKTTSQIMWQKISQPASLVYVSSPILRFVPLEGSRLDEAWDLESVYHLRLYFLQILPMGKHTIRFAEFDESAYTIVSHESGTLAKVWNHRITFKSTGESSISYCDEVEIKAGLLTPFIWGFAHCFYRHRQRRWKKVLKKDLF